MVNKLLNLLLVLCLLGVFTENIYSQQVTRDLSKVWSRIQVDPNPTNQYFDPNYKYNPNPRYQYYQFGNTDVMVMPNYRVWPGNNSTQSELSIDVHPLNPNILFASANATGLPASNIYGTGVYWTTNAGTSWTGFDQPPFGNNYGDPASAIGTNGYFYEGYITLAGGMGVATSTNGGANWTSSVASAMSSDDKNHLMVDKKVGSPYENRLYNVWTDFNLGANDGNIILKYSTNFGGTWSTLNNISSTLNPGSHDQGCNVQTGPNGEVYVCWAIYDAWPGGEDAIGFAKSTDGGVTFSPARIYSAVNFGIRGNLKPTQIRVASFPSMSVDRSGGSTNGNIYIVWPQRGVVPAGSDPDVVMIRSTDGGATWSAPLRVNDDALNNGKDQYFPWCSVDQNTGRFNVVFYDNRNTTNDSTGVYMATSVDGGLTFENFQVSDANFRPKPISGLAGGYQGDYIGITSANNKAYPFWADDRTGQYQAWITEVTFGPGISHTPLQNTENLAGPYAVNATITSQNPLVPGEVKLFWGRGVGVISDSLVMTNTSGNNYTGNIPGDGNPHIYNYYIKAVDNQGFFGTAPGGAPANLFTFEAATDLVPPTIAHTPLANQPQIRWPVGVSADVTDNLGVGTVECEFRVNGGSVTSFPMPLVSGSTYAGDFPSVTVNIGDVVEYRIKATDNSSQNNVAYSPASGYNSFNIIDVRGIVLVVDDDVTLANRISPDKGGEGDMVTPLGASATLFTSTLTNAGYLAEEVTFSSLNVSTLNDYDVIILSAGTNESLQFADAAKRAAIVAYTLAGGKTLVEGGEVGYQYRNTADPDPAFRRNVLNDSTWISDNSGQNLVLSTPTHPIFTTPNTITGPITVNNSTGFGWGARDEVTLLPNKPGVVRIANWSGGSANNPGILTYNPGNNADVCRNIFFTFSIAQFADQTVAANLIENAVEYLTRDIVPVELTSFAAVVSGENVNLNWTTATELNNQGFEIERKSAESDFVKIGYVIGYGTTTEARNYSYSDTKVPTGSYTYRLKQIDFDGTVDYSKAITVEVSAPLSFALDQNYPNPFNPSTTIKYSVATDGFVNVAVFNLLGEKVATLVNQTQKAGRYEVRFDASQLASGIYFYSIDAGDFNAVKKMMLMK